MPLATQAERRRPAVEAVPFEARFRLGLARNDAELILSAARSAGVPTPVIEAAHRALVDAEAAGWGELDYTAMIADP